MKKRIISFLLALFLVCGLFVPQLSGTASAAALKTSEDCIALLKELEGFRSHAWYDNGHYSIGYGCACEEGAYPGGITEAQADLLLREYLGTFESKLNSFAANHGITFSQQRFDALISFTYNLGTSWMGSDSVFRQAVISGATDNDFLYAIGRWCVAGAEGEKEVQEGLLKRRLIEANVYLNGVYDSEVSDDYRYVIFRNELEDVQNELALQAYDATTTEEIRAIPTRSGYRFMGWYTAAEGGEWVEVLNANTLVTDLYAHWQKDGSGDAAAAEYRRLTSGEQSICDAPGGTEIGRVKSGETIRVAADYLDEHGTKWAKLATGGWVDLSKTTGLATEIQGEEVCIEVEILTNGVNVRSGPGTNYNKVDRIFLNQTVTITRIVETEVYVWGRYTGGWICLDYTNYDTIINEAEADLESVTATGTIINTDWVNVRNAPGTIGTTVVGQYRRGEQIRITAQRDVNGVTWGLTEKGWVSLYYVLVKPVDSDTPSEPDAEAPETPETVIATGKVVNCTMLRVRSGPGTHNIQVGALATGSAVDIYAMTSVGGQTWGKIPQGWICMIYIQLDPVTSDSDEVVLGKVVNCTSLRVRSGAGTSYNQVSALEAGTLVEITQTVTVGSQTWGKISSGWICMEYISRVSSSEKEEPSDKDENPGAVPEKPEETKAQTGIIKGTDELRVRSGPGTGYPQVGTLNRGDVVVIQETIRVGSATWGRIQKGWISLYYVQLAEGRVPSGSFVGTVNTPQLKIRAGAGTSYEILGIYGKGSQVVILATTQVNGVTWGKTDKGWISLDYVNYTK